MTENDVKLIKIFDDITADMSRLNLFELQNVVAAMEFVASSPVGETLYTAISYLLFGTDYLDQCNLSCVNMVNMVNLPEDLRYVDKRARASVKLIFSQSQEMVSAFRRALEEKEVANETRMVK
jgi:hypothetical protein